MAARREQMSPWEWVLRYESAGSLATYSLLKLPRPGCFYPGPRGLLEPVSYVNGSPGGQPDESGMSSTSSRTFAARTLSSPLLRGAPRIVLFTEAGIPTP